MVDCIQGPVVNVVDGDTFDMQVTYYGKYNQNPYNLRERVRIKGINAPELNTLAGLDAKRSLQQALLGKQVKCDVYSRDLYNRVVANVKVL